MKIITHRLAFALLAFGAILSAGANSARSAELLMFEEKWCEWCQRWDAEIGPIYPKSAEGKRAPLRRVDIHGDFPSGVVLTSRPHYTPTFVLVDKGHEVGRIEGYPGQDFFWGLLARIMEKLPAPNLGPKSKSGDS